MSGSNRKRKSRRTFGSVWQLPSGRYRASYLAPDGKRRAGETTFATVADGRVALHHPGGHQQGEVATTRAQPRDRGRLRRAVAGSRRR